MKPVIYQITRAEEQSILNELKRTHSIDEGSSRIVFEGEDSPTAVSIMERLSINLPFVIKVAFASAGQVQSSYEQQTYLTNYESGVLAPIFAAGVFVEFMEEVNINDELSMVMENPYWPDCNYDELFDIAFKESGATNRWDFNFEEWVEENYGSLYDFAHEYRDQLPIDEGFCIECETVLNKLNDINGCTSDNGQVGYDHNDNIVAYDYGYTPYTCRDDQVSEYSHTAARQDGFATYANICIDILNEMETLDQVDFVNLEKRFEDEHFND